MEPNTSKHKYFIVGLVVLVIFVITINILVCFF